MKSDIIIIGGGASGFLAAYGAAKRLTEAGCSAQVTLLEKMPKPGRKIMITGKGRCNFTNVKDWNDFSSHIRSNPSFVKNSFYNLPSVSVVDFFEEYGMKTVVERGDRAYPASYHSGDVVDTLVTACKGLGVKIVTDMEVRSVDKDEKGMFSITCADGSSWQCPRLIVATGGKSYPATGSTGDGYVWAKNLGHKVKTLFPSLTALVPRGYKMEDKENQRDEHFHIDRSLPLTELGSSLCGIQLKNVSVSLLVDGNEAQDEFGDIDFTDGGIEGPVGFQISRKAVKSMINGASVRVVIDLKPGVGQEELLSRIKTLWDDIGKDSRSRNLKEKEKCRILLGKLMPWDLIPVFLTCNQGIFTLERKSRTQSKVWVNLSVIAKCLKQWEFVIDGYVGYERAVVTAGGVSTDEILPKTMESRLVSGLYFCGEVMDIDSDTGGYNLQTAFCTGFLAGRSAADSVIG